MNHMNTSLRFCHKKAIFITYLLGTKAILITPHAFYSLSKRKVRWYGHMPCMTPWIFCGGDPDPETPRAFVFPHRISRSFYIVVAAAPSRLWRKQCRHFPRRTWYTVHTCSSRTTELCVYPTNFANLGAGVASRMKGECFSLEMYMLCELHMH